MDQEQLQIKRFDGTDEILFSSVFNVYESELLLQNLRGFNFKFVFENIEPTEGQNDIVLQGKDKDVTIIFSKKVRNGLGGGTVQKMPVIKFTDNTVLLFTVHAQAFGENTSGLNVTVTFYLRKQP